MTAQPLPPEVLEELARIIATHEGYNPDTEVFDCDDDVNTVPAWMNYRQHARAVYAATARSTEAMRAENERLTDRVLALQNEAWTAQEKAETAELSLKAAREALEEIGEATWPGPDAVGRIQAFALRVLSNITPAGDEPK